MTRIGRIKMDLKNEKRRGGWHPPGMHNEPGNTTTGLLYEDLTRVIIAACFEVSNALGVGFLESVYEKALVMALNQRGLKAQTQVPINVKFKGAIVGQFFADVVVENKVLLELKAVETVSPAFQAQVINYLHASDIEVGLLINFGKSRVQINRLHKPEQDAQPEYPILIDN
jgi:GxxExxY protein